MTTPAHPSPADSPQEMQPPEGKSRRCLFHGVICLLGLSMMLFILLAVVPNFAQMFADLDLETVDLPASTRIVLGMSAVVRMLWFLFLPAAPAVSYAVSRVPGRRAILVELGLMLVMASFVILVAVGLFAPQIVMMTKIEAE
jgi:hypothetical protein